MKPLYLIFIDFIRYHSNMPFSFILLVSICHSPLPPLNVRAMYNYIFFYHKLASTRHSQFLVLEACPKCHSNLLPLNPSPGGCIIQKIMSNLVPNSNHPRLMSFVIQWNRKLFSQHGQLTAIWLITIWPYIIIFLHPPPHEMTFKSQCSKPDLWNLKS